MAEFATYEPDVPARSDLPVEVEPLRPDDVAACASLAAAREGDDEERWRTAFVAALDAPDQIVLVARHEGALVAYAKAARLDTQARGATGMPPGWYLTGLVVDPAHRRGGVARRLTEARLAVLSARDVDEVWYFAAAANQASVALHEQLGFREVTRDFALPGVTFTGGEGILARWVDDSSLRALDCHMAK